jgi:hypothetical protein
VLFLLLFFSYVSVCSFLCFACLSSVSACTFLCYIFLCFSFISFVFPLFTPAMSSHLNVVLESSSPLGEAKMSSVL